MMKRILLATVALSLVATPAAFAQSGQHHRYDARPHHSQVVKKKVVKKHVTKRQMAHRHWHKGHRFDRRARHVVVNDYRRHHLRTPPRGQHWVKVDNQYLLVGITSGLIMALVNAN